MNKITQFQQVIVLSLPMRDGNELVRDVQDKTMVVLSLPMRDGN